MRTLSLDLAHSDVDHEFGSSDEAGLIGCHEGAQPRSLWTSLMDLQSGGVGHVAVLLIVAPWMGS